MASVCGECSMTRTLRAVCYCRLRRSESDDVLVMLNVECCVQGARGVGQCESILNHHVYMWLVIRNTKKNTIYTICSAAQWECKARHLRTHMHIHESSHSIISSNSRADCRNSYFPARSLNHIKVVHFPPSAMKNIALLRSTHYRNILRMQGDNAAYIEHRCGSARERRSAQHPQQLMTIAL